MMPTKTRITKAPDERRSELIATAQQLFFTQGYDNTSVNDIVKAVNVAKGTFYYYFDTKLDVLEAIAEGFAQGALAVMHAIVADESLSALEKWQRAFQTTSAWKTERNEQLLVILRAMRRPENFLLQHKIEQLSIEVTTPEITQIIEQGIIEGVFETQFVEESAEITISIMRSVSDYLSDIILNPDAYENRLVIAQRKVAAIQDAVERVLGAPQGSLPLMDDATLAIWFSN